MPALALAVIAIALPDSLNPTLILGDLFFTAGKHPFRRTLAFTISAFAVTLAGGIVVGLGLGDLLLSLLPKLSHTVKWDVLTVVGVLLTGGGLVIWWRRDALTRRQPPSLDVSGKTGSPIPMG